jgi:hypothetical protein
VLGPVREAEGQFLIELSFQDRPADPHELLDVEAVGGADANFKFIDKELMHAASLDTPTEAAAVAQVAM